jgi:hypothetical protein
MIQYFAGISVGILIGWVICRIRYDIWRENDFRQKNRQIVMLKNEISRLLDKQEKLLRWKPTQRN